MNTTAHVIINSVLLGNGKKPALVAAILIGSLAPDLPMMVFYAWEKIINKASEHTIWSTLYFRENWQIFFDLFNSIPLIGLGIVACYLLKRVRCLAFFGGMLLHALGDLPLHRQDAHRHFYPLTDWRFHSPLSYWDPAHYGVAISAVEAIMVLLGVIYLVRTHQQQGLRIAFLLVGAAHVAYWMFALTMWG